MKSRKIFLSFLIAIFIFLNIVAAMFFTTNSTVYADTDSYFSDEQYTNSDYLLAENGTDSTKKIQEFAAEVKSAAVGTSFPELSQVIPLEYLESSQTEDTFQYNG